MILFVSGGDHGGCEDILYMMIYSFDGADTLEKECTSGNPSVPYLKIHDSPAIIYK